MTLPLLQSAIVKLEEIGRAAQPQLSSRAMHLSECRESFRSRRTADFKQRSSSSSEEEAAAKASFKQG